MQQNAAPENSEQKRSVMLFTGWFEPGYKAGGPIRSCVNIAYSLKNDFNLFVITTDRDLGASEAYEGITTDKWITHAEGFRVMYLSPSSLTWKVIRREIKKVQPNVLYLNSMYSVFFTLYPLLMKKKRIVQSQVILAPRGMLKRSALQFKKKKKLMFLKLFRFLNLHKKITFHATDETEVADVKRIFGDKVAVALVDDFPGSQKPVLVFPEKVSGQLRMLFVGRIHPIKNLDFLLTILKKVQNKVTLTIIGSLEDKDYWNLCRRLIDDLESNISVDFKGELPHHEIESNLLSHHLLILPTKGENFGHAIFESLAAGRPVIISDQTPWRNLSQHKAGWDIPLSEPQQFTQAIESAATMDQQTLNEWCSGAWNFCKNYIENSGTKEQYLKLFS